MPVRSKWQSLPTEAINPATLAIDKLSPGDIVEEMLHEDRKMLLAVQHEKDRITCGVEIIAQIDLIDLGARRHHGADRPVAEPHHAGDHLLLAPPAIITQEQITWAVDQLRQSIQEANSDGES